MENHFNSNNDSELPESFKTSNSQLLNADFIDGSIVTLLSGSDDEKRSLSNEYSEEGLIQPIDVLDWLLDDLFARLIEIPLKTSLQCIEDITSSVPDEYRSASIEYLLLKARDRINILDHSAFYNHALIVRLELIEDFAKRQLFSSPEHTLEAGLKVSQVVELADFIFYGTSLKDKYSRIHIYRLFGRFFGINTTDDSFKNTSVNNMNREKNKLLFIKTLKKKFEKEVNGGTSINLD
jgi:hypothetical protein